MTPAAIVQSYLDDVGTAVLVGDWESYASRVELPFCLTTRTAVITVATIEDLRAGFDDFHQMLQSQRITHYVRIVDSAEWAGQIHITGHYRTHLIAGAQRTVDPFSSAITLRLVGNLWRAPAITNALTNSRWPLLTPSPDKSNEGPDQ